jgi:hypothetical protein
MASPQDKKAAVPDAAAIKEAEQTVRELFKEDYAKKAPADRRALAKKLLTQGKETGNTTASQYALLSQAVEISTQTGDVDTALSTLNELTAVFTVNAVALRAGSLGTLAKNIKTSEDTKTLARAYLALADDALKADDFDNAGKAVVEGGGAARRAKDLPLTTASDAKAKEVGARKTRFEKVKKAKETLDASPDDAAANLVYGQYACLVKGDWAGGLACLAKSLDGNLKSAALKDSGNPATPDDQAAVGDLWWDLADAASAEDKVALRDRAGFWYRQAYAKIAGLGKVKVEKRLLLWNGERIARGTWVDFNDPAQFGLKGKPGDPVEIVHTTKGTATQINTKPFPPGEYDGFTMRFRFKMDEPFISLSFKGPGYIMPAYFILAGKGRTLSIPGEKGPGNPGQTLAINVTDEALITVLNSKGEDTVYLNGAEVGRYPNTLGPFDSFQMFCHQGTTTIDKIKLRRRA